MENSIFFVPLNIIAIALINIANLGDHTTVILNILLIISTLYFLIRQIIKDISNKK